MIKRVLKIGSAAMLALGLICAASVTPTWRVFVGQAETPGLMKRIDLAWIADTKTSTVLVTPAKILVGKVYAVTFKAGASVTTAYDVRLLDEDSQDLLQGRGANLTTATTSCDYSLIGPAPICGTVTLDVQHTTGTGTVVVFLE